MTQSVVVAVSCSHKGTQRPGEAHGLGQEIPIWPGSVGWMTLDTATHATL